MVLAITTVVGELDGFYALLIGLLVATMTTLVLENAVISGFYALLIGLLVATHLGQTVRIVPGFLCPLDRAARSDRAGALSGEGGTGSVSMPS